jgi:hypothetical protein
MAQQDLISLNIPAADLEEIKAAIAVLKTKLQPHLKDLTPQDRQELPKMGDKTSAFVQKALEYGQQYPDLVPSYLDLQAFAIDVQAIVLLREMAQGLVPLTDALEDSLMLSGSEAYQAALLFYNNAKNAAKAKMTNAASVAEDLSARFPGGAGRKKA